MNYHKIAKNCQPGSRTKKLTAIDYKYPDYNWLTLLQGAISIAKNPADYHISDLEGASGLIPTRCITIGFRSFKFPGLSGLKPKIIEARRKSGSNMN